VMGLRLARDGALPRIQQDILRCSSEHYLSAIGVARDVIPRLTVVIGKAVMPGIPVAVVTRGRQCGRRLSRRRARGVPGSDDDAVRQAA